MPQQNAAAGQAARNGQGQQRQEQTLTQTIIQILSRAMMAYAVMSFFNGGMSLFYSLSSQGSAILDSHRGITRVSQTHNGVFLNNRIRRKEGTSRSSPRLHR